MKLRKILSEPESLANAKAHRNEHQNVQSFPHRGIYLLPNLLTTGALFAGFYAIVASTQTHFETAAIALFVAMIMDTLDGRVARLTRTQSAFGAEYDSLSDMVCFGMAPALLSFHWGLSTMGKLGWLAAFIYTAATALRLARFNTQLNVTDKRYFIGLPCPAAAAVLASLVWIGTEFSVSTKTIGFGMVLILLTLALLMVSHAPYYSFKEIDFKNHVPFFAVLGVVLAFSIIAWDPPVILSMIFCAYALSGPFLWLKNRYYYATR